MPRIDLIQYRRGNATEWASANPQLADGEVGYERDTYKLKVGDGTNNWNDLSYIQAAGNVRITAGGSSADLSSLAFFNANGVSFGLSGSTITASVAPGAFTGSTALRHTSADSQLRFTSQDTQLRFTSADSQLQFTSANSRFMQEWHLTGNTAGTQSSAQGSQLFLQGGSNVTLSGSSNTIVISAAAGGGGALSISAGGSSATLASLVLSNSNGIGFGLNGSTITASHNGLTSQSAQALSGSNGSFTFQTATLGNLNGVSFYTSNGSVVASHNAITSQTVQTQNMVSLLGSTGNISFGNANGITFGGNNSTLTASHDGLTSQSNQALSAGNGSFAFQTASFSNANGISFSTSAGSAIVASHNAITSQTNQTIGAYALGNTTDSSSGTLDARSLSFRGLGVASVGVTNNSIEISVPAGGGGAGTNTIGMSNIGNTAGDTAIRSGTGMQIVFAGGNNITLSQSTNNSNATITISGPNTAAQTVESNTFGMSNIGNTAGTTGVVSAGQARYLFAGGNNITLSQSLNGASGTLTISAAAQTVQPIGTNTIGMSNIGNTAGNTAIRSGTGMQIVFAGGNNITLSQSTNGSNATITVSAFNQSVQPQTNQTLGLYAVSNTTQSTSGTVDARTLSFQGAGGLSVGISNGSVILSGATGGGGGGGTLSMYATGNTTQQTSDTQPASSVMFQGAGIVSVGQSNGSVIISGGSAVPSPVVVSAGTSSGSISSIVYVDSNQFSWGLSGSTITGQTPNFSSLSATGAVSIATAGSTISIGVPQVTLPYFEPGDINIGLMTNIRDIVTRPIFSPFNLGGYLTNSSLIFQMSRSTSGSNNFTVFAGIYTYANETSINLLGSTSNAYSGTATASMSGVRYFVLTGWPSAVTALTPGGYVLGMIFSGGGGGQTASFNYSLFGDQTASLPAGFINAGTDQNDTSNTTRGAVNMWGRYTANSAALPSAVAQSHLLANFTGASAPLAPWFILRP